MIKKIGHYSLENPATAYDEESLTALQLAARTAGKVNECIDKVNDIPSMIDADIRRNIEAGTFDRQMDEHNAELLQQIEETEATLAAEISAAETAMENELNATEANLGARLDNLLGKVTVGTTSGDAELIDARLGANGTNYNSLGTAIREQFLLSWKRARNIWRNSANTTGYYVIFDDNTQTVTIKANTYQGVYSRIVVPNDIVVNYSSFSGDTFVLALSTDAKSAYIKTAVSNFNNPADILIAHIFLWEGKVQRTWTDANVEKFVSHNGKTINEIREARSGANGVTYDTLGIAIREQFNLSWKRSRNIWRHCRAGKPVVLFDTTAKTITVDGNYGYHGIYSWYQPRTTTCSWDGLTDETYVVVLSTTGQGVYIKHCTAVFNNPNDIMLCNMYINTNSSFGRVWADANIEKLISVDGVPLDKVNATAGFKNTNTANIFRKVVCIGDSLTAGHMKNVLTGTTVTYCPEFAYPKFMEKLTGNTYVNCGVSGATVQSWQSGNGYTRAVEAGKAQAYLIRLMGNDVNTGEELGTMADIESDTATTYIGGYGQIIRKMKAISPNAKFFICTDPRTGSQFPEFNEAVRQIAEYFDNVYCLDLLKNHTLFSAPSFTGDALEGHYTATGYEQMAEIYRYLIGEIINANPTEFQSVPFIPYD